MEQSVQAWPFLRAYTRILRLRALSPILEGTGHKCAARRNRELPRAGSAAALRRILLRDLWNSVDSHQAAQVGFPVLPGGRNAGSERLFKRDACYCPSCNGVVFDPCGLLRWKQLNNKPAATQGEGHVLPSMRTSAARNGMFQSGCMRKTAGSRRASGCDRRKGRL